MMIGDIVLINLHHDTHDKTYVTLDLMEKFDGQLRWKIGLGTQPCIRTRVDKRCTFCGFTDLQHPLPADKVDTVFQMLLQRTSLEAVKRLELYVSGSFFDDVEVTPASRLAILRTFRHSPISEILIESRPEFITAPRLNALTEVIEPHRVTVGIGVETMNDEVRKPLSKGTTTKKIVQSIQLIARAGMNFQAYFLLKPPGVSSDQAAVRRFLNDVQMLLDLTQDQQCTITIALQPTFVAHHTVFADDFKRGIFRPVWLYTIALVLQRLLLLKADHPRMRIILGNENDNVEVMAVPMNYANLTTYQPCSCSQPMREMLHHANESELQLIRATQQLLQSPCACRALWQKEMQAHPNNSISVPARISLTE